MFQKLLNLQKIASNIILTIILYFNLSNVLAIRSFNLSGAYLQRKFESSLSRHLGQIRHHWQLTRVSLYYLNGTLDSNDFEVRTVRDI